MLYQCFALVWSTVTILISGPVLVEIHQQGDSLYNKNTMIQVCSGCFDELQVTSKEPFYFQERSGHNLALTGSIKFNAVCPANLSDSNDHFTLPKRAGSTQQLVSSQETGVSTAVPLFLLLTSPEIGPTTAVTVYFNQDVNLGMLQGGYNVQFFCQANTSHVPILTRWEDPTPSGKQNSNLVLWNEEDCVSAISVFAIPLPDESAFDSPNLCYSEEGITCAHDDQGADTAIIVWDSDLTPMNTFVNDPSNMYICNNKKTSAVPKRDPEMILVTKEVFYTYFAIVVSVIGALLVNNCITFSEGQKTEKNLKNKIAVYEAIGEQCVKVHQDMSVQARKEKSYLKRKKKQLGVASAQKCIMMKTAQQCQLIHYKTKLGKKAKKTEVKAHIAKLRNEIGKAKKENAEIQEKHKCADTLKKHINMELEEKEGIKSQTKEAIKEMKEKTARLTISKKVNEKRITETNENIEDVKKEIQSVVWQIDEKELEILNVVKQTRIDVCEYNSRLCEAMSLMPGHSLKDLLPYQPAAAVISSGPTAPDGFGCSQQLLLQPRLRMEFWNQEKAQQKNFLLA